MSGKFNMNKKAQYYEPPRPSYSAVHPIFIIGIFITILPFLCPVVGVHPSTFFKTVCSFLGICGIIFGAVLSIYKASN